jgi:hypothetical protein
MQRKRILARFCPLFLTLFIIPFTLSACNTQPDYLSYVSELRRDVFIGEKDNFCVVVYAGMKESPALFDGIKQNTTLCLGFKIIQKEETGSQLTVKFTINNKNYTAPLTFNPVKSTLFCEVEVSALPEESLEVEICYGDKSTVITAASQLNENTISYTKALESAVKKGADFLKDHTKKGVLQAEIVIRLLCERGKNYYYVGFICEKGLKKAYIIDGENGEVIAEKNT